MLKKSLIALGAVAGIGLLWTSRRYLYEKTKEYLKSEKELFYEQNTLAAQPANIDVGISMTDNDSQQDVVDELSTLGAQITTVDEIPTTDASQQDVVDELRTLGNQITTVDEVPTTDASEQELFYEQNTLAAQPANIDDGIPMTDNDSLQDVVDELSTLGDQITTVDEIPTTDADVVDELRTLGNQITTDDRIPTTDTSEQDVKDELRTLGNQITTVDEVPTTDANQQNLVHELSTLGNQITTDDKIPMTDTCDVNKPEFLMKHVATQVNLLRLNTSKTSSERPSPSRSGSSSETSLETQVIAVPHQYYVGPAMISTQPLPPPASVVIASGFSFPPPPVPEYYIGPVLFHTAGPPPLPCCVVASRFSYPPPLPEYLSSGSAIFDFPPPEPPINDV